MHSAYSSRVSPHSYMSTHVLEMWANHSPIHSAEPPLCSVQVGFQLYDFVLKSTSLNRVLGWVDPTRLCVDRV